MIPLTIILAIIMIWCFYFRFMKAVMARKRLIWVEVLDQKNSDIYISRFLAKQNLHLVGEVTQKLRSYNYLFDKYWYRQREYQYIDAISNVEQQQFSNNLTETHLKNFDDSKHNDNISPNGIAATPHDKFNGELDQQIESQSNGDNNIETPNLKDATPPLMQKKHNKDIEKTKERLKHEEA